MKKYRTVAGEGSGEYIVRKSRFFPHAAPAFSREEADEYIHCIRKAYREATSCVPAMVIGEHMEIQWASDGGEPQGTSGAPIVQLLVNEGITNTAVVVPRIFGGIKLGTGGLVRAFTKAASIALEDAGLCDVMEKTVLYYQTDYSIYNRVSTYQFPMDVLLGDPEYTDMVKIPLICDPEDREEVKRFLAGISSGSAVLIREEQREVKVPYEKKVDKNV